MDKFVKVEQIGKITLKHIKAHREQGPVYSDGPVEKELYYRFRCNANYCADSDNKKFSSWAHEYHLSPVRHNLLKWYPFDPDGSVLEVGAGCGALTGLLCDKLRKVVALEYGLKRALVTAQRHSERSNLEVVIGGLQDFETDGRFDYITVIGVLEYAGVFYGGENPYASFLTKLLNMLSPDGELILAIENKFGLKYMCGAPEDHTGRIFDSIYDYPYSSEVRTFSRKELAELFHEAGFYNLKWYYPIPDYKMPQEVLSDEITPSDFDSIWRWFPARTVGSPRREILSEKRFGKTIAKTGLFGEFANSFLVVARTEHVAEKFKCLRFWGANQARKPEYQTHVEICQKDQEKLVIREAETNKAIAFIQEIAKREALASNFVAEKAEVVTGRLAGSCLYYPCVDHPSLQDLVAKAIETGDRFFGKSLIEDYRSLVCDFPSETCIPHEFMREFAIKPRIKTKPVNCLQKALLDCVPRNIKVSKEKRYIIDNEWTYDFPLPIDFLIFRGIMSLITDLQDMIQNKVSDDMPVAIFQGYGKRRQYIPFSWLEILRAAEIPIDEMACWERHIQNRILSASRSLRLKLKKTAKILVSGRQLRRLEKNPKPFAHVAINEIKTNSATLYPIRVVLQKAQNRLLRFFNCRPVRKD